MQLRPLPILLAVTVALMPLRAASLASPGAGDGHGHVHHHVHAHGGLVHTHVHHHHHGDAGERDSEDHHGAAQHAPDVPAVRWIGPPRRPGSDAPPAQAVAALSTLTAASDWQPRRRAKPPPAPAAALRHLTALRTVVLRL